MKTLFLILAVTVAAHGAALAEPEAEAEAQQPLPAIGAGLGQVQVHAQSPHANGFYYHVQTYDNEPRAQPIAAVQPVAYAQPQQDYMPQGYGLNPYMYNQYNPYLFNGGYNGYNLGYSGSNGLTHLGGYPYHLNTFAHAPAFYNQAPVLINPQALAHENLAHPEQLAHPGQQLQLQ